MFDSIHWHVYGFRGIVDEITGFGLIGKILENMELTPENVKVAAIISYIVLVIGAYFLGNISPSTILAKRRGLDIKKEGSGNAGTTNALRVMGKKAGVITLVIDICKGVLAVLLAELIAGEACGMYCAVAVIIGHVWPLVYKFKGGKGVATTFGALVAINPMLGIWTLLVVAVVTFLSKRMSAGSVSGAIAFPVICLFNEPEFIVWGTLLAFIVLVKHRSNIVRLLEGTEPKLGFLDKDKKKAEESDVTAEEPAAEADQSASEEPAAEPEAVADQPTVEEETAVPEQPAEEEKVADEVEQAEENEPAAPETNVEEPAAETAEKTEASETEAAEPKPEKYKRPKTDKTVKKNGKKKKTYPNKNKNNGQKNGGKNNSKNNGQKKKNSKGKSSKKGGKKK